MKTVEIQLRVPAGWYQLVNAIILKVSMVLPTLGAGVQWTWGPDER